MSNDDKHKTPPKGSAPEDEERRGPGPARAEPVRHAEGELGELGRTEEAAQMIRASFCEEEIRVPDKEGLLAEVFSEARSESEGDSPDERLRDAATELSRGVDTMLSPLGGDEEARPGEMEELLAVCRMIHASHAPPALGTFKRRRVLQEAFGDRASRRTATDRPPQEGRPASADGEGVEPSLISEPRSRNIWAWAATAVAAGLAAVVVTLAVRRSGDPAVDRQPVDRDARRRIARLIPGPFPPDQSATRRAEILYSERLHAHRFRLLELAPSSSSSDRDRTVARLAGSMRRASSNISALRAEAGWWVEGSRARLGRRDEKRAVAPIQLAWRSF